DALVVAPGIEGMFEILRHRANIGHVGVVLPFVIPLFNRNGGQFGEHGSAVHWLKVFLGVAVGDRAPGSGPGAQGRPAGAGAGVKNKAAARPGHKLIVGRRSGHRAGIVAPDKSPIIDGLRVTSGSKTVGTRRNIDSSPANRGMIPTAIVVGAAHDGFVSHRPAVVIRPAAQRSVIAGVRVSQSAVHGGSISSGAVASKERPGGAPPPNKGAGGSRGIVN